MSHRCPGAPPSRRRLAPPGGKAAERSQSPAIFDAGAGPLERDTVVLTWLPPGAFQRQRMNERCQERTPVPLIETSSSSMLRSGWHGEGGRLTKVRFQAAPGGLSGRHNPLQRWLSPDREE